MLGTEFFTFNFVTFVEYRCKRLKIAYMRDAIELQPVTRDRIWFHIEGVLYCCALFTSWKNGTNCGYLDIKISS